MPKGIYKKTKNYLGRKIKLKSQQRKRLEGEK
jgi:hypothetical protein